MGKPTESCARAGEESLRTVSGIWWAVRPIGGGEPKAAMGRDSTVGDTHWGFDRHVHIGSIAVASKKVQNSVRLLTVHGTSKCLKGGLDGSATVFVCWDRGLDQLLKSRAW